MTSRLAGSSAVSVAALALACGLLVAGCPPTQRSLTVRAQSGLRAGYEVRHVEARLFAGAVSCRGGGAPLAQAGRTLTPEDQGALGAGTVTLGAFEGLAPGVYTVRALFRRPPADPRAAPEDGEVLVSRCVVVTLSSDRVVRVALTSDCVAVSCPVPGGSPEFDQCLNGRCVDPRCDPDDPSTLPYCCDRALLGAACDTEPTLCGGASDCAGRAGCTAPARCEEGVCVEPEAETCEEGSYCERATGTCRPETDLPPPADAGVPDASVLDATDVDAPDVDAPSLDAPVDAGQDAGLRPLVTPPALALSGSSVVATADVVSLALMSTGERVTTGRMPAGRSEVGGIAFERAGPGGFIDPLARGFTMFDMLATAGLEGGPRATAAEGSLLLLTGVFAPGRSSGPCMGGDFAAPEAYVAGYDVSSLSCGWARLAGGTADEAVGAAFVWNDPRLGGPEALVPLRAVGSAFGGTFRVGGVLGLDLSTEGTIVRRWDLSFAAHGVAARGTDIVVVGADGQVAALDATASEASPPRWQRALTLPIAPRTDLYSVVVDDTSIYAVGAITSGTGTPLLGGGQDGFVVAADREGTLRWWLVFGGTFDDRATRLALSFDGTRLLVGGEAVGTSTVGLRSEPAVRFSTEQEAILVELDPRTGEITAALRHADHYVAEIVALGGNRFVVATQHSVLDVE
jgi:hypothetical protein